MATRRYSLVAAPVDRRSAPCRPGVALCGNEPLTHSRSQQLRLQQALVEQEIVEREAVELRPEGGFGSMRSSRMRV